MFGLIVCKWCLEPWHRLSLSCVLLLCLFSCMTSLFLHLCRENLTLKGIDQGNLSCLRLLRTANVNFHFLGSLTCIFKH